MLPWATAQQHRDMRDPSSSFTIIPIIYYTKKLGDKQACGQMSYGTQESFLLGENPANSIFISLSLYDNQAWRCTNEIILLS